ncbi:MAG: hypothetical protein RQ867_10805 [Mariprofundaceae bacterium]|nr:hypothetical protein [Mariprofundaceae bacterium]
MSKSLLLHSLSLKDRILEPNKLPLNGQVWAYNKQSHSKEAFVGNCLTMLSLLGMQDADIHWKEDILAFDARWQNRTYTIIISLQDDSLASEHYYFLGIWECPEENSHKKQHRFADSRPWNDEDLIKPDISYSVTVGSQPLEMPDITRQLAGEFFGQSIYGGDYYLCGTTDPDHNHAGKFALFPATRQTNHTGHHIQHALYSLRNLMALMGKTVEIHDKTLADTSYVELKQKQQALSLSTIAPALDPSEYGRVACSYGEVLLQACDLLDRYDNRAKQINKVGMLFDNIVTELKAEESPLFRPLFHRMKLPCKHAEALLNEHVDGTVRIEKQAQVLQQTLHSRMLANQLLMIETLTERQKED